MTDSDKKDLLPGLYRSPPATYRFGKGTSGNPKGRPRKDRAIVATNVGRHLNFGFDSRISALLMQEAYRPITIREGDRVEKLPLIQAVLRKLGLNALNGNVRSQRTLLEYVTGNESA